MPTGFWRAVSKVAHDLGLEPEGYSIVANHRPNGGQLVFHFHVHILGGRQMSHAMRQHARNLAPRPDKSRRTALARCWRRRALAPRSGRAPGAPSRRRRAFTSEGKPRHAPVRFTSKSAATLAGTLLLPLISELQEVPGVVLVAGSGPTDRNGNNPLVPERIDLLKQIAELLAHNGIASLRYDKRGIGDSTPRPRGSLAAEEARLRLGQFRRRCRGRPHRAAAPRRGQALRHRPAGPQRGRAAGARPRQSLWREEGACAGADGHARPTSSTRSCGAGRAQRAGPLRGAVDHTIATILGERPRAGQPADAS